MACDNSFTLFMNGKQIGAQSNAPLTSSTTTITANIGNTVI